MSHEFDRERFIGFWHPFGAHGRESREQIITRKREEIQNNHGWTFWSFQFRTDKTLEQWLQQIGKEEPVFVFCSDSKYASDPKGEPVYAKNFKEPSSNQWQPIPSTIKIPHPFGKREYGSAFKISDVQLLESLDGLPINHIQWFSANGWRNDNLPTRGEWLIKSGGDSNSRSIYAILKLEFPYVVTINR